MRWVVIVHGPARFMIQYAGHIIDQATPLAKLMPQAFAPAQ
jgi:hypothetical protein